MPRKIHREYIVLITCVVLFFIGSILGMVYVAPKEVHQKYYGLEFQSGNPDFMKRVLIEIDGQFKRKLWGFNGRDTFIGTISIDGEQYTGSSHINPNEIDFVNSYGSSRGNNYGFTIYGQDRKGDFYKKGMLEEIAILFYEPDNSLVLNSVRVIAGPCDSREEAVKLANSFINKRYSTLVE